MARTAKKRANGLGSVRKRSDGRWMARIWLVDQITSERKRYTFYGATAVEAQSKMEDAGAATRRGDSLAAGDQPTLKTFGDHWLKLRTEASDARPRVVRRYREILEYHVFPTLGGTKMAELDVSQIRTLMQDKRKAGLSPRTCNHIRSVVRAVLSSAMEETTKGKNKYGLTVNVAAGRKLTMKVPDQGQQAFNDAQALQLLDLAKTHDDGAIWTLAITTGLRQSELLGLRWADVDDLEDCEGATLTIRKTIQRTKDTWLVQDPKSDAGARDVPLTSIGCEALKRQRQEQREARIKVGKRWKPAVDSKGEPITDLVFTTATGAPRQGTVITHRFHDALKDAGLPQIRFHGLRHSTGSLLNRLKVPARDIKDILGHSDIHTTLQLYVEGTGDDRREAMAALNARLGG